jgi:hypothetical protein
MPCLGFMVMFLCPVLHFCRAPSPAFPSLVPTPDETSHIHIRGFRLSPGPLVGVTRSVTFLSVGRSVGCGLPGESESEGRVFFVVVAMFVVVMYTMCRFIGFVCLFVAWLHRDKRLEERLVGWLIDWRVALLTLGVG